MTTRPDTAIEMSSHFTVVTLDYLKNTEYQSVIRKLSANTQFANSLINAIKTNKSTLSNLLCTPLLVTLLLIQYVSVQRLPEQISDFYESIFFVLLQRHDRSKPGFVRERLCSLNDRQYRDVFDAFCFESMKTYKSQFSAVDIQKVISRAMQILNINEDPTNFFTDISSVTCLVLHEGEEYRFIHKSVQEYYSASFISSRSDNIVIKFYNACKSDYFTYLKWNQVLSFLSEIDKYRYHKYYLIPLCHKWLNVDNDEDLLDSSPPITPELTKHIFEGFVVGLDPSADNSVRSLNLNTLGQILPEEEYLDIFEFDFKDLLSQIQNKTISINYELLKRNRFESRVLRRSYTNFDMPDITAEQIYEEGFFISKLTSLAARIVHDIYEIWQQACSYVNREDTLDITSDLGI